MFPPPGNGFMPMLPAYRRKYTLIKSYTCMTQAITRIKDTETKFPGLNTEEANFIQDPSYWGTIECLTLALSQLMSQHCRVGRGRDFHSLVHTEQSVTHNSVKHHLSITEQASITQPFCPRHFGSSLLTNYAHWTICIRDLQLQDFEGDVSSVHRQAST